MSINWKKVVLSGDTPLVDALEKLDAGALGILLVTDSNHRLLGTVTDGDIRRGLLKGKQMDCRIDSLMNSDPFIATPNTPKHEVISIMESKAIFALPIVQDGIVIGLETLQHILQQVEHENPVFIMAGGFGTRLAPLTNECPKPLLPVGDKPILETTLAHLINHGFRNFYISTHYKSEMIVSHFGNGEDWGVNIDYVHEDSPLGTGGALSLLPDNIPKLPLLIMNGDILTSLNFKDLLHFHKKHGGVATMCVREFTYQIPYGVIDGKEGKVTSMVEKPSHTYHVNAGIYVIDHDLISMVDDGEQVDMPTLLERQLLDGKSVSMFPIHEYWLDIGRLEDFHRAQSDILDLGI